VESYLWKQKVHKVIQHLIETILSLTIWEAECDLLYVGWERATDP